MVERVVHIDDVRGSNPLSPTIIAKSAPFVARFCAFGASVFLLQTCLHPRAAIATPCEQLEGYTFEGC